MVTIYPSGDTYVDKTPGNEDTNYSGATILHISKKRYTWDGRKRVLLQFDISALSGVTITSATLGVYWGYSDVASRGKPLTVHRTTSAWNPATVTYNSQPTYTGGGALMYLGNWSWRTSNIVTQLQDAIDSGDPTFGVIIIFQNEDEEFARFGRCSSVETGSKPYISFEYVSTHIISGNVKDNYGTNLSGATVEFDDGSSYSTTTDGDGNYSKEVNADVYTVTASKSGYISESASVDATTSDETQNFVLSKPIISGNVKDSGGNNLNNVTISLNDGTSYETTTDASGNYSKEVDADVYTVTASLAGYLPNSAVVDATSSDKVQNFVLSKSVISGNVKDTLGNNINGVEISCTNDNSYSTTTDSNGDYLQNVDPDVYTVTASLAGYLPESASVDATASDQTQNFILSTDTAPHDKGIILESRELVQSNI